MESTKILLGFFIIIGLLHGASFLSVGNITPQSVLIFKEFFYGIADRTETIGTEENISAIRAVDVSGRDGEAVLSYYSAREIAIVFFNENVGQGYNVSLELYTTRSGAATRSLSVFSIALSMIVVSLYVF